MELPARWGDSLAAVLLLSALACSDGDDRTRLEGAAQATDDSMSQAGASSDAAAGATCASGELRCRGAVVERCEQGSFTAVDTCATEQLCADTVTQCDVAPEVCASAVCLPPVCEAGELRCNGNIHELCNEGRTAFIVEENCGPLCGGQHCNVADGCVADVCLPDEVLCAPEGLTRCNEDCSAYAAVSCELLDRCDFCGH